MGDRDDDGDDGDDGLPTAVRAEFEHRLRDRLAEIFSAQPWLIAGEVEQGAVRLAGEIQAIGGASVLAVGARPGVGQLDDSIRLISMGLPDEGSMVANIRSAHRHFADPAAEIQAEVDAWDPDGSARALCGLTAQAGLIFGRASFGARQAAWLALEDKLAIEDVFVAAGIPLAPSTQVPIADADQLLVAHQRLATELGTVWAGDNAMGWHGGGQGTFWVPDVASVADLPDRLAGYCSVRIMPFLEGIPCSIHGMVLPTGGDESESAGIAVFRPCEMMMMRDRQATRLVYGRAGSYWDPSPADRLAMGETARKIGAELRRRVNYRGVFTVDGIMSAAGFRPTEVNTRYGAALSSEMATISGEPIELFQVHLALVEGLLDDVDLAPLERWATSNLDAARRAVGMFGTGRMPETERRAVVGRGPSGNLSLDESTAGGPTAPLAEVRWGAGPDGGLLLVEAKQGMPVGPPTAPTMLEIVAIMDQAWDIDAPDLVAAEQVR